MKKGVGVIETDSFRRQREIVTSEEYFLDSSYAISESDRCCVSFIFMRIMNEEAGQQPWQEAWETDSCGCPQGIKIITQIELERRYRSVQTQQ